MLRPTLRFKGRAPSDGPPQVETHPGWGFSPMAETCAVVRAACGARGMSHGVQGCAYDPYPRRHRRLARKHIYSGRVLNDAHRGEVVEMVLVAALGDEWPRNRRQSSPFAATRSHLWRCRLLRRRSPRQTPKSLNCSKKRHDSSRKSEPRMENGAPANPGWFRSSASRRLQVRERQTNSLSPHATTEVSGNRPRSAVFARRPSRVFDLHSIDTASFRPL